MKINKQQFCDLFSDKEEYTLAEVFSKINNFSKQIEAFSQRELAATLREYFNKQFDPADSHKQCLLYLYNYFKKYSYSFYAHIQNLRLDEDEEEYKEKPKYFSSLEECREEMAKTILKASALLGLDFYKVMYEGCEPCIEEYACACEFEEYMESTKGEGWDKEELEEALGSCLDMIAPRKDRDAFYESLVK